ncbi:PD-(D/E)XK nuclease family protein [Flavobacterium sp. F-328]|uniref:PD-(D/E)XK nuclease family protein n=1 Tax=Flavobacterium erciyesense TaxID=2825842 RepID=A0ABS5D157_9FLAO|nr:PD-(D/E)XK nuclease family protein [Flavobacterium erciyesense]MBQ0907758.1 PD-(D/E)XK nuclease family protein [Flavobacterium erciyesense]
MKPNIFRWASSELSQDAFICWLLSWANHKESKELYETSKLFIQKLSNGKVNDFDKIEVRKQIDNIDILCIVDDCKVILIEDKVHTKNHGDQLERYLNNQLKNYSKENIFPIYFKTGDQSNYKAIEKIGYKLFLRKEFIEVLKFGIDSGIQNEIFVDFYHHLNGIENSVQSYLNLPVEQWHWDSWKGFYSKLQKELGDGDWDYVPQMNGGFLGFWWHWKWNKVTDDIGYDYYLQLEHKKFCFKLTPKKREDAEKTREHFRSLLYPKAKEHQINIYQNGRIGNWMTAAALSEPYLKTDENGFLDLNVTVENIKKIQKMFDEV